MHTRRRCACDLACCVAESGRHGSVEKLRDGALGNVHLKRQVADVELACLQGGDGVQGQAATSNTKFNGRRGERGAGPPDPAGLIRKGGEVITLHITGS